MKKKHVHRVTINDRRRRNKKRRDLSSKKGAPGENLQDIFDDYYRTPLTALYKKIKGR